MCDARTADETAVLKPNASHARPADDAAQIDLQRANGISLYYPAEGTDLLALPPDLPVGDTLAASTPYSYTAIYADYLKNQLFDFTRAARWGEFLQVAYGTPPEGSPLELPSVPLAPPAPPSNRLYLPVVMKK